MRNQGISLAFSLSPAQKETAGIYTKEGKALVAECWQRAELQVVDAEITERINEIAQYQGASEMKGKYVKVTSARCFFSFQ